MANKVTNLFGIISLGLTIVGGLLICEVIRPFRDLSIDGPIALGCWGVGAVLGLACFFVKGRSLFFSIFALVVNVLPLLGALVLWWLLSQSNFAWH
ncbi:MAG TPA: hypothetical protein VGL24_13125 [Chthoniobacterales bacterium]|jgi:hypothetical protein